MNQYQEHSFDILSTVLESAFEGVVVVNENAEIIHFNAAYSRLTGIKKEDALGQHVSIIIDNTRLHHVLKTGVTERGEIQVICGQEMIVHRIPIWKGNKVVAAVGMLIFEGVSELYKILERHQDNDRKNEKSIPMSSIKKHKKELITLNEIIGKSKQIAETKRLARRAAKTLATVLITGESGTGKEMFAQSIHHLSPFSKGPFVSLNCAAIPDHLFEAELFGYEEGAFTGARKGGKPGKFELASQGTLFLDEIGDMPMKMQSKILRILQEKEGVRVGGVKLYRTSVRIIAATNKSLEQMVREGLFREDLYYRLNIIRLHIPPLRERKEDIPLILAYYVREICSKYKIDTKRFTSEAMAQLLTHEWRGNIREVVNWVERIVSLVEKEEITVTDLRLHFGHESFSATNEKMKTEIRENIQQSEDLMEESEDLMEALKQERQMQEKEIILRVLRETNGNKSKAAKQLGIHRSTLYDKLQKHNIK